MAAGGIRSSSSCTQLRKGAGSLRWQLHYKRQQRRRRWSHVLTCVAPCACRSVACGHEHTVCITTKDVFAWGSNEYGQLGHGDAAPDTCSRPFPIKVLHDVMVTQVRRTAGERPRLLQSAFESSLDLIQCVCDADCVEDASQLSPLVCHGAVIILHSVSACGAPPVSSCTRRRICVLC
jgi:hypothetical protein